MWKRVIGSPEKRKIAADQAIFQDMRHIFDYHKNRVRAEAAAELRRLHSDIEIIINSQSQYFYGYSPSSKQLYAGVIHEEFLPSIFKLEEFIGKPSFLEKAEEFKESITNQELYKNRDGREYEGNNFSWYNELCTIEEVMIYKNGNIIARSNIFYPKEAGYFYRVIRNKVLEDISGGDDLGISTIKIKMQYGFHSGMNCDEIHYSYVDTPRNSQHQNIEHYQKTAFLFLPFLIAIEGALIDPVEPAFIEKPTDRDVDDTLIGLPPNKHRNPSLRKSWSV